MNPVIEAINSRCSVRAYDSKPVPKEILDKIIEAGNRVQKAEAGRKTVK